VHPDAWPLLTPQQAVMGENMKEMSQEERKDFITQQMDALQHELEKVSDNVHLSTKSITTCLLHLVPDSEAPRQGAVVLRTVNIAYSRQQRVDHRGVLWIRRRRGFPMQQTPPCRSRSRAAF
jgi:hypothetical protein